MERGLKRTEKDKKFFVLVLRIAIAIMTFNWAIFLVSLGTMYKQKHCVSTIN